MPRKNRLSQMPAEVPEFVVKKADALVKAVGPLGHPRTVRGDVIGALVDAATPQQAAEALTRYNPKLGKELARLDS